jgi:hypothetical protein
VLAILYGCFYFQKIITNYHLGFDFLIILGNYDTKPYNCIQQRSFLAQGVKRKVLDNNLAPKIY